MNIKGEIYLFPYEMPSALEEAIRSFVEYYNYQRYHEGLGNVTPFDVFMGRHFEIKQHRKEVKSRTLKARRSYNGDARGKSTAFLFRKGNETLICWINVVSY